MTPRGECRLLQALVAIGSLVPIAAGAQGALHGPGFLGHPPAIPADLDSHVRYLSGILFAIGVAFASCVPRIEARGARFRLLGALVVTGGIARLGSLAGSGAPSAGHLFGFAMELGATPLLMLWQARVARCWARRA